MTGTPAKSKSKGKSVSVERKQGDCSPCSFRHDHSKRGASKRSSPISKSQTNNDGMIFSKIFERQAVQREQSIREKAPESDLCVKFTKHKQAACLASVRSCRKRRTDSRRKKRVSRPYSECEAIGLSILRSGDAESQIDFTEGQ